MAWEDKVQSRGLRAGTVYGTDGEDDDDLELHDERDWIPGWVETAGRSQSPIALGLPSSNVLVSSSSVVGGSSGASGSRKKRRAESSLIWVGASASPAKRSKTGAISTNSLSAVDGRTDVARDGAAGANGQTTRARRANGTSKAT